jgi:cysteinyl-tRNA synthetase
MKIMHSLLEKIEKNIENKFKSAMDDDFNSAKAIGYLFEDLKELNSHIQASDFKTDRNIKMILASIYEKLTDVLNVLSFDFKDIDGAASAEPER